MKPVKDPSSREAEVRLIRLKLGEFGFAEDDLTGINRALDEFVTAGIGVTQKFKFRHLGVEVLLQLSTQPHITSFARLRKM